MQTGYIGGHARTTLFSRVGSQASQGGSEDFGAFNVEKYSRFTGVVLADSVGATGITFRYRMGVNSGTYEVSSSVTVGSGGAVFDEINYGNAADFAFTAIDTDTSYNILILGEPLR